jgi:hypothetical protein
MSGFYGMHGLLPDAELPGEGGGVTKSIARPRDPTGP